MITLKCVSPLSLLRNAFPSSSLRAHFSASAAEESSRWSPVDDYEITGFIGKGSTSRVYQGYHLLTGQEVIIKLFKDIITEEKILREVRVNQIIYQCPDIVPLLDVVRDQGCGHYGLIFKNLHGVPLTHLMAGLDFKTGLGYMKDVLRALDYCHKHRVVHRDLKKSNILITKGGAKLFDFGLGYIEGVHQFVTKRFGTKGYYTPEVMFRTPQFTRKIDIWVCGLIMAEVLTQKKTLMPYTSDLDTARQIVEFSGFDPNIVDNEGLKYIKKVNFKKLLADSTQDQNLIAGAA